MNSTRPDISNPCLYLLALLLSLNPAARADQASAMAAMEDPGNPLLLLDTSAGQIFLELLPAEAPDNVANFMALAGGEVEIIDPNTNTGFRPRYFDGMRFHRVIPDFLIQAGSPQHNPLGAPPGQLRDEINASALGLEQQPLLLEDGSFNPLLSISDQEQFADQVLRPLYVDMGIRDQARLQQRQYDVLERLQQMNLKQLYELQGFSYQDASATRAISRGVVALANSGPDSNGPEFFIALTDAAPLDGRYTVIGRVAEGMAVADRIGATAIDPQRASRRATVIFAVRRLN